MDVREQPWAEWMEDTIKALNGNDNNGMLLLIDNGDGVWVRWWSLEYAQACEMLYSAAAHLDEMFDDEETVD